MNTVLSPRRALALALLLLWASAGALAQAGPEPTPAPAKRTVHVGLYVLDLQRVDDARREAEVDFVVVCAWQDPSLAGRYEQPTVVPRDSIWNPDVGVFNNRDLRSQRSEHLSVDPEGRVTRMQRYIGTIRTQFDLSDFPLDSHALAIELASSKSEEVELALQPELIGQSEAFSLPGWRWGAGRAELFEHQLLHLRLPGFRYSLPLTRMTGYYFWNVLLPLALVVLMSLTSLWIPAKAPAPRIGVAATSMLTVIAYRFALAQHVPELDYLTRLDLFLLVATGLVFATVVVAVAATRWHAQGREELAETLDRRGRWALPSLFALTGAGAMLL